MLDVMKFRQVRDEYFRATRFAVRRQLGDVSLRVEPFSLPVAIQAEVVMGPILLGEALPQ